MVHFFDDCVDQPAVIENLFRSVVQVRWQTRKERLMCLRDGPIRARECNAAINGPSTFPAELGERQVILSDCELIKPLENLVILFLRGHLLLDERLQ